MPHRHIDTGFLNRTVAVNGSVYHYQVYLPEGWNEHGSWPVILFLHGSGERGSEGMDETQIGLPQAIRIHPDRWPFLVVMPQVPFGHHRWTDPDMMQMALTALDQDTKEFHGDPDRTYLTGLSLGGYGVYELARYHPRRFAALVPVSGGIFWSYKPDRWKEAATLPGEYARAIGHTPVWIFHGSDDNVVPVKEAQLMYEALKLSNGNVRFWQYAGWRHNVWDKAYNLPELPKWLLAHRLSSTPKLQPLSEEVLVPLHPVPARINPDIYDDYAGVYEDEGTVEATIQRQGDRLLNRNRTGDVLELLPENTNTFFYATGSATRLIFERDEHGEVKGILYRDDRHEEFWEKKR
ncbi:alpha/beta hydrolase-fold protein [Silvibacterium sp.]|uniref:alpha/beta hydrolase-fold protein n=1 Tax=Silvibacterium sp. TaxID=1964179 RepID=UPI0039E22C88